MATMSANETQRKIGEFVDTNSASIINAINNHARRMQEAADLADQQGQPNYATVFRDEAESSQRVVDVLAGLVEELAEERQDDFANQA
jgi:hypothetical protein